MRIKWFMGGGGFPDSVCKASTRLQQGAEEAEAVEHTAWFKVRAV